MFLDVGEEGSSYVSRIGFIRNLGYIILSKFISSSTSPRGRYTIKHGIL